MRRVAVCFGICASLLAGFTGAAHAGWTLYDNFEGGSIDPAKWDVDDSSAVITVEGGRAKFVHQPGFPGDNSYLIFKTQREIRGISATVRVEGCSGDVRGRLMINKWVDGQGNQVYMQINAQAQSSLLYAHSGYYNPDTTLDTTRYYGRFMSNIPIEGVDHRLTLVVTNKFFQATADDLGWMLFSSPQAESLSLKEEPFYGIGTRSSNGDSPCTVYFDDVYVLY